MLGKPFYVCALLFVEQSPVLFWSDITNLVREKWTSLPIRLDIINCRVTTSHFEYVMSPDSQPAITSFDLSNPDGDDKQNDDK